MVGAARQLIERALVLYNRGDLDELLTMYADEALDIGPDGPCWGRAAIGQRLRGLRVAFPDQQLKPVIWLEDQNRVAVEYSWSATHAGSLLLSNGTYLPASGEQLVVGAVSIFQMHDAHIAAHRMYLDRLTPAMQAGSVSINAPPISTL